MNRIKLSLFCALSLRLSFLEIECATPSVISDNPFESAPAVWRSIRATPYYHTHTSLQQKVVSSPSCGSHNRVYAVMHIETSNGVVLIQDIDRIFKSNHAYSLDGREENDKGTLEGHCAKTRREFKESATQVVSEGDPHQALQFLSFHPQVSTALTKALQDLVPLRKFEHDYKTFYPFKAVNYHSRLLDSESSLCRLIESKVTELSEIPQKTLIRLHMHSDNNSCFYCVQLLHYLAKKWAEETNVSWLIMVSSHQAYNWKGTLPPGFESLQQKSMRTYCQDDRYDQELTAEEIQKYSYSPGIPWKCHTNIYAKCF